MGTSLAGLLEPRRCAGLYYELSEDEGEDPGEAQERKFLTQTRSSERERERLRRISEEVERGFRQLYTLGPAVTVFGSAWFREGTPHNKLGREAGCELARAGFAVITGGGPRMMEAANCGAKGIGGRSIGSEKLERVE